MLYVEQMFYKNRRLGARSAPRRQPGFLREVWNAFMCWCQEQCQSQVGPQGNEQPQHWEEIRPSQTKAEDMSTRIVKVTICQGQVFCQVDSFIAKLNLDGLKTSKQIELLMKPEVTTCVMGTESCILPGNAFSGKDPFVFRLQKGRSLMPFNKGKETTISQGKTFICLEDKSSIDTSAKKIKVKILGEKLTVKLDNVKVVMTSDQISIKEGKKDLLLLNCSSTTVQLPIKEGKKDLLNCSSTTAQLPIRGSNKEIYVTLGKMQEETQ